jgi:hypothetical protein
VSHQPGKHGSGSKWIPVQNAISYILCHVRKVNYKQNESDSDDEGSFRVADKVIHPDMSSKASTPQKAEDEE